MKVRFLTCSCVAIALVAAINMRASAAGQLSQETLASMGLSGLTVMSDDDALAVRGFGYKSSKTTAKAWGSSWAQISTHGGTAGSKNGYNAEGKHSASGNNLSFAGALIIESGGHGGGGYGGGGGGNTAQMGGDGGHDSHGGNVKVKAVVVFAGGSSSAKVH